MENEARSARIAATVADEVTYLGAHLVPAGADADEYTDLVCGPMLDAVPPYAAWADVFCERGAFTEEQSPAGAGRPAPTRAWACACTATSWARAPASGWRWSSARPAWTT